MQSSGPHGSFWLEIDRSHNVRIAVHSCPVCNGKGFYDFLITANEIWPKAEQGMDIKCNALTDSSDANCW